MPETHIASGKIREIYAIDDERLLLVASDRISTFDVVLPTEIPDKGRVLTGLSGYWFTLLGPIVPNHMLAIRDDGRSMECRRLEMLPIECVVRGYLAGSGWKDYRASGEVCGHRLPEGLQESDKLPEPIFTPATKATEGHDENITREQAAELVGEERFREVEEVSLRLYKTAADHALRAGLIIADTKFELGLDADGNLVLGDEALTPDSSRFWPGDTYEPGRAQDSFDKQYVRDYTMQTGWDKTDPGPELPEDVVQVTRKKYHEAFERLTTIPFPAYLDDPKRGARVRATVLVRPKPGILDPQGEAVGSALGHLGFDVQDARVGKVIDLELEAADEATAKAEVEQMCERLLANPLIESYEVEIVG